MFQFFFRVEIIETNISMEFQLASRFMMHERVEVIVRLVRTEFSACCVINRNDEADCDFFFGTFALAQTSPTSVTLRWQLALTGIADD